MEGLHHELEHPLGFLARNTTAHPPPNASQHMWQEFITEAWKDHKLAKDAVATAARGEAVTTDRSISLHPRAAPA